MVLGVDNNKGDLIHQHIFKVDLKVNIIVDLEVLEMVLKLCLDVIAAWRQYY